jgi:RNA recognition motif-containing protein
VQLVVINLNLTIFFFIILGLVNPSKFEIKLIKEENIDEMLLIAQNTKHIDTTGKKKQLKPPRVSIDVNHLKSIFIGNLSYDIDKNDLLNKLNVKVNNKLNVGSNNNSNDDDANNQIIENKINSIRLVNDDSDRFLGYGYIHVNNEEDVDIIMDIIRHYQYKSRILTIDRADPSRKQSINRRHNLDRGGEYSKEFDDYCLVDDFDEESLDNNSNNSNSNNSNNNNFYKRNNDKDNDDYIRSSREYRMSSRNNRDSFKSKNIVNQSNERGSKYNKATLYFGNLSFKVDKDILRNEIENFSGYNSVKSVRLGVNESTGELKGYAFVDFYDQSVAFKVSGRYVLLLNLMFYFIYFVKLNF